jgi:Na+-translocating ferredoxin:NAD+ oxidoreductase RnfD subunit
MKSTQLMSTLAFYPNRNPKLRVFALWYFSTLITVWTILGHLALGFEQSYAQPLIAVAVACVMQYLLEFVDAKATHRPVRFAKDPLSALNFLPVGIIPGLACAMLIYANSRLAPVAFAAALSIASKVIFRAPVGEGQTQHVFNPSNIGITATLLLFPSVGLAPPYQFTENVTGAWDWIIPGVILLAGIYIHAKFTGRLYLVAAWLLGFAVQALIRSAVFGLPLVVPFVPVTSAAFILFTLFIIPDPATTPIDATRQVAFGFAVATVYGILFIFHLVYGLFIALCVTSASRGVGLYLIDALKRRERRAIALSEMPSLPTGTY